MADLKVFKICSSEFLPPEKDRPNNYVYFVYDKLEVYNGKNIYNDIYAIVESVPTENPASNILYLTMDGYVKVFYDNEWINLAYTDDQEELEYLRKAGTTFLMKSEYRYLDRQTKRLSVPYQNGSFQVSVALPGDVVIDKNTIIQYDPEKREWVLGGHIDVDPEGIIDLNNYTSGLTSTADTHITDKNHIAVDVRLSEDENNMIEIKGNGLFVNAYDLAKQSQLQSIQNQFNNFKNTTNSTLNYLDSVMEDIKEAISDEALREKIIEELTKLHYDIDYYVNKYNIMRSDINNFLATVPSLINTEVSSAETRIDNYISEIDKTWGFLGEQSTPGFDPNHILLCEVITMMLIDTRFVQFRILVDSVDTTDQFIVFDRSKYPYPEIGDEFDYDEMLTKQLINLTLSSGQYRAFYSYANCPDNLVILHTTYYTEQQLFIVNAFEYFTKPL